MWSSLFPIGLQANIFVFFCFPLLATYPPVESVLTHLQKQDKAISDQLWLRYCCSWISWSRYEGRVGLCTYMGSRDVVAPILNVGSRWRWVVDVTLWPLYHREWTPVLHRRLCRPPLVWTWGERKFSMLFIPCFIDNRVMTLNKGVCAFCWFGVRKKSCPYRNSNSGSSSP